MYKIIVITKRNVISKKFYSRRKSLRYGRKMRRKWFNVTMFCSSSSSIIYFGKCKKNKKINKNNDVKICQECGGEINSSGVCCFYYTAELGKSHNAEMDVEYNVEYITPYRHGYMREAICENKKIYP